MCVTSIVLCLPSHVLVIFSMWQLLPTTQAELICDAFMAASSRKAAHALQTKMGPFEVLLKHEGLDDQSIK